jgi:hypothetical protein
MVLPMTFVTQKSNFWTPSLCGFAMIGGIVYGYQMEILSKPFSFMLPGHRLIFRRLIFTVQAFWLLLGVMLILIFWPQDMLHRVFGSILILAAGNLAFWLGKGWADKTRQPQALIGLMAPVIIFGSMLSDNATVEKVMFNPLLIVIIAVLGGGVTFRMWHRLGQLSLFASYCGLENIVTFSFSQKRLQKLRQQQFAKSPGARAEDFLSGVETFFLKRIERTRHKPVASFVYGAIYQGLGPTLLCQLKAKGWSVIWMFAMFLLFGYYGKLGDYIIWIIFLFPIFMTDLQVHSTLLLTRGRSQRYIMTLSRLVFTTITTLGFVFIYLGLTRILEPYMPAIHLRSLNTTFHAPDWHMWYLFAAGVPLLAASNLLFRGSAYFYLSCCIVMGGMFGISFGTTLLQGRIPGIWIAPIILVTWALFAAYLYRVCFKKSLTTQK